MFRLFGLLLVGLVLAGCQTGQRLVSHQAIKTITKATASTYGTLSNSAQTASGGFDYSNANDTQLCRLARFGNHQAVEEARSRKLTCLDEMANQMAKERAKKAAEEQLFLTSLTEKSLCRSATFELSGKTQWKKAKFGLFPAKPYVKEAKRRGLSCGVGEASDTQIASSTNSQTTTIQTNSSEWSNVSDATLCSTASTISFSDGSRVWSDLHVDDWVAEAKRRGLSCGVGDSKNTKVAATATAKTIDETKELSISFINHKTGAILKASEDGKNVFFVGNKNKWFKKVSKLVDNGSRVRVALHLNDENKCSSLSARFGKLVDAKNTYSHGVKGILIHSTDVIVPEYYSSGSKKYLDLFVKAIPDGTWFCAGGYNVTSSKHTTAWNKLKKVIPKETVWASPSYLANINEQSLCSNATRNGKWETSAKWKTYVQEAKRRGLTCGVGEISTTQIASSTTTQSNTPTSAELLAAQRKAEELEQQLAALKAEQEQQMQTISNDTQIPLITIASANTKGKQGVIRGKASDNVGVAEVTIDGNAVAVQSNGSFEYSTFVPATGLTVTVQATDVAGLSSKQTVSLQRNINLASATISFDRLNPIGKPALKNKDAIALIIGIGSYENIIDAAYADKDALMFRDYAAEKLGIPESRIKTLINEDAEIGEVLLGIRKWIRRSTKPDKTDVYVFYAGHGIATANGEAYILPYDGRPEVDLLDRTALLQKELFAEIEKANPRNVTIFLDACYTGKARTGEVLMADANYRPIAIRPIDDGMPDNFTLITASSGDEFSGPLEEAKHGLFSYFLMKGMEGDADSNQDSKITAGELHQFVKENVLRQSADKQTPELQGNADRVLVTFK